MAMAMRDSEAVAILFDVIVELARLMVEKPYNCEA
jgi:hypothetical protein